MTPPGAPSSASPLSRLQRLLRDQLNDNGPLLRRVWKLSLPVIVANLLQSLVNVVDVFMAGRLGPVEVAAVGMSNAVRLLVLLAVLAVTSGSMALAAQAKGGRDDAELSRVAKQSLSLTGWVALALTALGVWAAEPLLGFLNSGGDPLAVTLGTDYLQILFLGTVFLVGNLAINSLMQGAGDTVTPLLLSAGVNVLNVVFNVLLVFGVGPLPELGVPGLAFGTVAARALGVAAGLAVLASGRNVVRLLPGGWRPEPAAYRDILAIGVPAALQALAYTTANLLVLRIITSTPAGTYGAAAQAIGVQIESFAFMPGLALSVAATSLVGQALGAWQTDEARRRGNVALALGVLVMGSVAALLFAFAPFLVRAFEPSAHPTVVRAGVSYLRINALSQPILAFFMILNGALRGAGDTRPGLVATFVGRWLGVVPLAYGLALGLGLGVDGVWWALFAGTCLQSLWVAARWRSGRWLRVALRKSRLYREHLHHLPAAELTGFLDGVRAPLMAHPEAAERLEPDGVRYELPDGRVRVRFARGVEVVEGASLLERQRTSVRPPPPAAAAPPRRRSRP